MASRCHILIIEDEPLIAMQIRDVLEREGVTSFSQADTQEGAVQAAMIDPPQVIVSDVKLTRGTGPRAVETIHRQLGEMPVIFITATPGDCVPCAPPGQVLCKPLNENELANAFHGLEHD